MPSSLRSVAEPFAFQTIQTSATHQRTAHPRCLCYLVKRRVSNIRKLAIRVLLVGLQLDACRGRSLWFLFLSGTDDLFVSVICATCLCLSTFLGAHLLENELQLSVDPPLSCCGGEHCQPFSKVSAQNRVI